MWFGLLITRSGGPGGSAQAPGRGAPAPLEREGHCAFGSGVSPTWSRSSGLGASSPKALRMGAGNAEAEGGDQQRPCGPG